MSTRKYLMSSGMAVLLSSTMTFNCLAAAGWKLENGSWKYENVDGTHMTGGWRWLDSDGNGKEKCYYFDENGMMLSDTKTPDGYQVNADGAWTVNGQIQEKYVQWPGVVKGQWIQNDQIWKYVKSDGMPAANGWYWIDGNQDGIAECYYFDQNGKLITDGVTPDGYQVDKNGAWTVNGNVQSVTSDGRINPPELNKNTGSTTQSGKNTGGGRGSDSGSDDIKPSSPEKPSEPDKPEKPSEPDKPEKPSNPDQPDKPSEPEQPAENIEEARNLMVVPMGETAESIAIVWDKPENYENVIAYQVYQNGELVATREANQTHYVARNLNEDTEYEFEVTCVYKNNQISNAVSVTGQTTLWGEVLDVTKEPYNAKGDGSTKDTEAIQKAIDDCPAGGTVLLPEGKTFISGALDLHSNMTFLVNGKLKGSEDPEDYLEKDPATKRKTDKHGLIWNRFEGWELYSYKSLINAGYLNPDDREETTCENLTIRGKGTIEGGGRAGASDKNTTLAWAMRKAYEKMCKEDGISLTASEESRVRGRLINFIQCKDVNLSDLNLKLPMCWTVQITYTDTLTTYGMNIDTSGVRNGDGWDPDSSKNLMIFDCDFSTGDDCIAIKSGKGKEGEDIGIPTENVKIFDIRCPGGLGLAVGSEMSGGVKDVYIRDAQLTGTRYGIEIKAHPSRGGYVKDIYVQDSTINRVWIHSVTYNNDGEPGADFPYFQDMVFKNCVIEGYSKMYSNSEKEIVNPVLLEGFTNIKGFTHNDDVQGHPVSEHYISGLVFDDITVGEDVKPERTIKMKHSDDITYRNVKQVNGMMPSYSYDESNVTNIHIENDVPEFTTGIEAECMELDGFEYAKYENTASNQYVIQTSEEELTGTAKAVYTGADIQTDLNVTYYDTDAGSAVYEVYVNDQLIASWTGDKNAASGGVSDQSRMVRKIPFVQLHEGDVITLKGIGDGKEFAWLDKIDCTESNQYPVMIDHTTMDGTDLKSVTLFAKDAGSTVTVKAEILDAENTVVKTAEKEVTSLTAGEQTVMFDTPITIGEKEYYKVSVYNKATGEQISEDSYMSRYSSTDVKNSGDGELLVDVGADTITVMEDATVGEISSLIKPADGGVQTYRFYEDEAGVEAEKPLDETAGLSEGNLLVVTAMDGKTKATYKVMVQSSLVEDEMVNLALNKTVMSSNYQDKYPAEHAVDGILLDSRNSNGADTMENLGGNAWKSKSNSKERWIEVDLGAVYPVELLRIYWESKDARQYYYKVETKETEEDDYTEVFNHTKESSPRDSRDVFKEGSTARFVKITVTGCSNESGSKYTQATIRELRVLTREELLDNVVTDPEEKGWVNAALEDDVSVTASSTASGYSPKYVVDDKILDGETGALEDTKGGNAWKNDRGKSAPWTIELDLGKEYPAELLRIYWESKDARQYLYYVQTKLKENDTYGDKVFNHTDGSAPYMTDDRFENSKDVRFVKITVTGCINKDGKKDSSIKQAAIREIQLWTSGEGTDPTDRLDPDLASPSNATSSDSLAGDILEEDVLEDLETEENSREEEIDLPEADLPKKDTEELLPEEAEADRETASDGETEKEETVNKAESEDKEDIKEESGEKSEEKEEIADKEDKNESLEESDNELDNKEESVKDEQDNKDFAQISDDSDKKEKNMSEEEPDREVAEEPKEKSYEK